MRPVIVWFRRDLRVHDNAALYHAARERAPLIPFFIFDKELIRKLPCDGAAFEFQAQALRDLERSLGLLGGTLVTRRGNVFDVHKEIIGDLNPGALYFNRDYEPYATERDRHIEQLYRASGIEVRTFKDSVLREPVELLTGDGRPYVVFTPYARAWGKQQHPVPFGKARRFSTPRIASGGIFGAEDLSKKVTITEPLFVGGETQAQKRWRSFLKGSIGRYQEDRNFPARDGTSQMSPYLRFGCISIRRMYDDCMRALRLAAPSERLSIQKFIEELVWREFYQSVLFHFPRLLDTSYRQEFDRAAWKFNDNLFEAWKNGETGFPLVDAGMRQLNRAGWMHNRLRMVVASFLTKDLHHDWRLGERYFEGKLLDIETASNNGGWQWSASTGVDPKPMRIFNPRLQSERYDPEGEYIRRYVPELRGVPSKFIHAPHEMPQSLQKEIGCVVGKHYPHPIVEHAEAAEKYKRMFGAMKSDRK